MPDRIPELLTLDAKWEEKYEDNILLTKCRLYTLLTILAVQKIHGAHNLNDGFQTVTDIWHPNEWVEMTGF